jgi:DNA-binding IclR family transcriptional regulator
MFRDRREILCLRELGPTMGLSAALLAPRLSMTEAATRGMLVSLRHRGYVVRLSDWPAWRITAAGRTALMGG